MNEPKTVSPGTLNDMIERGEMVHLIDVRTPAEYRSGHALGAISIPLDRLSPEIVSKRLGDATAGQEAPLFLTCQSGFRAQQAAERLRNAGYPNLYLVDGGTEAWLNSGLPMQRCAHAISLERQVQITIGVLLVLKVFFGFTVHELFFAAIPLIGAGLIVAGVTRWCGLARLIATMPWNRKLDCAKRITV